MKKILVTGGAGFIGSHSVDALLKKGYQVTVLDNLSTGKITYLDLFNPDLQFIPGDVLDFSTLLVHVKRNDAILHLAALPSVKASIDDPIASLKTNTQGFLHVLEAIRQSQKSMRLVYASSAAVYGNCEQLPCSETQFSQPLSPYAIEKAHNENYAKLYAELFHINSLGLRYFNVYGSRQDPKSSYAGVISKFISHYELDLPLTIFGDGQQSRDFIHVSDVAEANVLSLESSSAGVLNIATGIPQTLLELIQHIEKNGQKQARVHFQPARVGDIKNSFADTEHARRQLHFASQMSLQDGMALLLA